MLIFSPDYFTLFLFSSEFSELRLQRKSPDIEKQGFFAVVFINRELQRKAGQYILKGQMSLLQKNLET